MTTLPEDTFEGKQANGSDIVNHEAITDEGVVDVLNELLENCRDGAYGFTACAEHAVSVETRELFMKRAADCSQAADELVTLIRARAGEPADGGTAAGALHRGWIELKGTVGADGELSILESCERGEDSGLARYRKALKHALPEDVRSVVQRQADGAQRNHDLIRDLRNIARDMNEED